MNPMKKAQVEAEVGKDRRAGIITPARVAIYLHLAAVCITASFAWLDRHGRLPPEAGIAGLALGGLMWASFLALFACPLTAVLGFLHRPSWRTADACIVEFGLVIAQVVALLPMVQ